MKRACLGLPGLRCGVLLERGNRCPIHERLWQRVRRGTTAQRGYGSAWQTYSKARVAEVGYCQVQPCPYPDCGTPANPLTTDHVTLGLVLCRRANAAKQHADRRRGGRVATEIV